MTTIAGYRLNEGIAIPGVIPVAGDLIVRNKSHNQFIMVSASDDSTLTIMGSEAPDDYLVEGVGIRDLSAGVSLAIDPPALSSGFFIVDLNFIAEWLKGVVSIYPSTDVSRLWLLEDY